MEQISGLWLGFADAGRCGTATGAEAQLEAAQRATPQPTAAHDRGKPSNIHGHHLYFADLIVGKDRAHSLVRR